MRLEATRSSMSFGSTGPAVAGAVCAVARAATSALAAPATNARRPSPGDMAKSLPPPGERRAEILERVEKGGERRGHRLVAAAHEADLADERGRKSHRGEAAVGDIGLHRELRRHRQTEAGLDEFLHRLRVAELHRRARRHAGAREPRVDLAANRAAAVEQDQ